MELKFSDRKQHLKLRSEAKVLNQVIYIGYVKIIRIKFASKSIICNHSRSIWKFGIFVWDLTIECPHFTLVKESWVIEIIHFFVSGTNLNGRDHVLHLIGVKKKDNFRVENCALKIWSFFKRLIRIDGFYKIIVINFICKSNMASRLNAEVF